MVSSESDVGFVATQSLAGGRLADDLKDTPVAYSVQTSEFLEALNLTDVSAAAAWTVGATDINDNGSREIFGAPTQISLRGGDNVTTVRDFFRFAVRYDSYNLDRIDYARGPNAVLFGNGDYSGTINAVTRKAVLGKNSSSLKLSYGSWENQRVTLGVNQSVTDTVAMRVDALWQQREGWQDFESEKKKAITGNLIWKATPRTTLQLQAEVGEIERNNPLDNFLDNVTGWDGVTTFSGPVTNAQNSAANQRTQGFARYGSPTAPYFVYTNALGATNLAQTARTVGGNLNANVAVGGQHVVGATASVSGAPIGETINLPASRFDLALAGSNFFLPHRGFGLSTNNPTFVQDFKSFSAFLDHQVGDRLFLQVAANHSKERRWTEYMNSRGISNVWIDINSKNPDGTDNVHFLDAYSQSPRERIEIGFTIDDVRASAAYVTDETVLGKFSFNLAYQHSASNYIIQPWVYGVRYTSDPRTWANSNLLQYRYYWGETNNPVPEVGTITQGGNTYDVAWTPNIASANPSIADTTLNTVQAAIKDSLFNGRLHLLAAVRYDEYLGQATLTMAQMDYPVDWDAKSFLYRPAAPADYASLTNAQQEKYSPPDVETNETTYTTGAVAHVTPTVSVFTNYSTTFNPNASRQLIDGSFAKPQVASEWGGGVRYTLPNGRLALTLGYYSGEQENQLYDPGATSTTNLNNIIEVPLPIGSSYVSNLRSVPRFFDLRDVRNEGWELEVTANPTKDWRISLNAAIPRAYSTNNDRNFVAYMATNDAALRSLLAASGVTIDGNNLAAATNPDAADAAAGWNFLQNRLNNNITGDQLQQRLNLYTANVFTDYRFSSGPLRGLRVGAGVNFRGKQVIGYRGGDTIVDPANPANAIDDPNVDAFDTVTADAYHLVTLTLGYQFKNVKWVKPRLALTVTNLLDFDKPLYYNTLQRPAGGDLSSPARVATPARYHFINPRAYNLTMSFDF
ncbi:MAG: hypothetical protein IT582_10535 [Opitutaceae bacterium]|nr:hypothetical protein [Opitutaceae bacterium]